MGGRELIRMETVQDAFVACFQIIPFPCRFRNGFFQSVLKRLEVLSGTSEESTGT